MLTNSACQISPGSFSGSWPVASVRMDHASARLSTPGEYRTKLFLNRELSGTPQYAIWGSLLQCRPHAELYPLATDRQRKIPSVSVLLTSATSNPGAGCTASVKRKFHRMRILRPAYLYGSCRPTLPINATLIILLDTWIFALKSSKSRRTRVQESVPRARGTCLQVRP